ncbi:G protein-regulated inducer of neurite outgrowth 1 [Neolamprologus brichardi]|uniref:G protein-regulated inducer of neurite outgrowth 1 n=1 Tax=Neolamprologus brichardi TaxID=32507 RepID=UPI001643F120|nr:G protein-regulated inducer of neurite outgrowth 1 [Neolamprologus brichardi]
MGSLKDEMRGVTEDHQPCEKTDNGGRPGGSDSTAAPEGPQLYRSQESATQGDYQPALQGNVSSVEEKEKNLISKDQVLSGGDYGNADLTDTERVKNCTQIDAMPATEEHNKTTTAATNNDAKVTIKFLSDGDGKPEIQEENFEDQNLNRGKDAGIEKISVAVPSTPDPCDPRSPAPFGQHHMRTQVSLEVVQCCSAATSPMTPPEGSHSFFFPSSFGKPQAVGTDTKDAELQVGQQVEFCSVATSPMTPKSPYSMAFQEVIGREPVQRDEKVKKNEEQRETGQQETKVSADAASETTESLKFTTSKEMTESSTNGVDAELIGAHVSVEDSNQQCKQQRMGSMDQDITILVTQYGNNEEEETDEAESFFYSVEPEMVKIDEDEVGESCSDIKRKEGKGKSLSESVHGSTNDPQSKVPSAAVSQHPKTCTGSEQSEVEDKDAREEERVVSAKKSPIPESPAPFGCHNIRTQVSLEVVQCQSVATSPMTPPEGDQAFYFPTSFGKCGAVGTGTKDAELQVGQQVEFRSVATAPMTPRTPTIMTFPQVMKEPSIEEKIVEEEEENKEEATEEKEEKKEEEKVTQEKKVEGVEENTKEEINCKEKDEEKCEEPVQEVSWDEKGMTWEVYGAVVEVAVLGSAIQKHLEKQVKKQKRQSSMPPPPPLNPSATPLTSEIAQGGSGKGRAGRRGEHDGKAGRRRRNPFRLLMENMQQPHCCSRAHTTE